MRQISLALLLFSSCNFLSAMEQSAMEQIDHMITLPSQEVLLKQLQPIKEYEHFLQNSPFIETFANKQKYAPELFGVLGFQIDAYYEKFKNDRQAFHLTMLKPKVITILLQDHPHTIAFFKKEKILAEPVSLPSAPILQDYLKAGGFDHLASNSHIVQQLANQQKHPTEIFMIIDSHVVEYIKKLNHPIMATLFLKLIPKITKTILQKHLDAIEFLINEQLLK